MRSETISSQNNTVGITPSAPWRIRMVRPLEAYRLYIKFIDGLEGVVDLSQLIVSKNAGVFAKLRDEEFFKEVYLDYGAVSWPGDLDLAPDAMYEAIKEQSEWVLQ